MTWKWRDWQDVSRWGYSAAGAQATLSNKNPIQWDPLNKGEKIKNRLEVVQPVKGKPGQLKKKKESAENKNSLFFFIFYCSSNVISLFFFSLFHVSQTAAARRRRYNRTFVFNRKTSSAQTKTCSDRISVIVYSFQSTCTKGTSGFTSDSSQPTRLSSKPKTHR